MIFTPNRRERSCPPVVSSIQQNLVKTDLVAIALAFNVSPSHVALLSDRRCFSALYLRARLWHRLCTLSVFNFPFPLPSRGALFFSRFVVSFTAPFRRGNNNYLFTTARARDAKNGKRVALIILSRDRQPRPLSLPHCSALPSHRPQVVLRVYRTRRNARAT